MGPIYQLFTEGKKSLWAFVVGNGYRRSNNRNNVGSYNNAGDNDNNGNDDNIDNNDDNLPSSLEALLFKQLLMLPQFNQFFG